MFTTTLPRCEAEYPYPIRRTPATGQLLGIATSTDLVGCYTHFFNNRTVPCGRPGECEAHDAGFSTRFHVYLAAIDPKTSEQYILELTAAASDTFRNYVRLAGDLRGCCFQCYRPSKRANGRISVVCRANDPTKYAIPNPPNVPKLLCHIWNIPYTPDIVGGNGNAGNDRASADAADSSLVQQLALAIGSGPRKC